MTQCEMILNHLEKYHQITPREALSRYGVMRLGARIWDLKRAGYLITNEWEVSQNRFCERTRYARYVLRGDEE